MPAVMTREPTENAAADAAAARLREQANRIESPLRAPVAVSVVHARQQLANGAVVALRCTARQLTDR